MTGAAGVAAMTGAGASAKPAQLSLGGPAIGSGKSTYTLDENWGKLPEGMKYGLGCAVIVDGKGRIFVTSRSTSPCVAIFGKDGQLLETWSKEFATGVG